MAGQTFQEAMDSKVAQAEEIIGRYLPKAEGLQKTVIEAMNYSILAGGKRLRPVIMAESYRIFGGSSQVIEPFMAAIEMIHTYSLVHDDLPAMDNDECRRGRETTWKVYGDGMGVLAGDALLNFAFETALGAFKYAESQEMYDRIVRALSVLAKKAGIYGMIGGQTADIEAENQDSKIPVSNEQLLFIHEHKTAALIQASMLVGAILAGASDKDIEAMERCGYNVGIAFQIQDDILDVTGDSKELGKNTGSDESNNKQTYVTINGLDKSAGDVEKMSNEAVHILESLGRESGFLSELITKLINRKK